MSMMHYYYDVHYKDNFDELFEGKWIHENPTEERSQYLVLSLNFSKVSPNPAKLEEEFLNYIKITAVDFARKYKAILSANKKFAFYSEGIEKGNSATEILNNILTLCSGVNQKLYVIIDEYDNFTNTILTESGEEAYQGLTRGEGFFRSFFNILKAGTGGTDAPIKRLFISGVSPVTMDDVTSGFNIGEQVARDLNLSQMLGFTIDDLKDMIGYYQSKGKLTGSTDDLIDIMTQWYGNYRFSEADNVSLFNSDMVLYFLKNYMKQQKLPENLIDRNVRIDYGKLRYLIIVDETPGKPPTTNGNFSNLKQIIQDGETITRLVDGFPIDELTHTENFKSLLFYLGLLTIRSTELGETILSIPNETVRRLYFDYIKTVYEETEMFSLDLSMYRSLMKEMAAKGEWLPLFNYITGRMKENISLRDLITGEKTVQAFLHVYLSLSDLFIVHSEKEMNKGYADLVMEPFLAKYESIGFSYLIELKYVKAGIKGDDPQINSIRESAEAQLKRYAMDEKFNKTVGKTTLIKILLIFSGHEAVYTGEVK
jgi:hypothetical protein